MADNQNVSILLIGSGRLFQHLTRYFSLLHISFDSWDRQQDPQALKTKIQKATHVLLAISDKAIDGFYNLHLAGHDKVCIHFSGAHHHPEIIGAHPLMTFGESLYEQSFYEKIHFTLDQDVPLAKAIPGLKNSFSTISAENKALYHALCVVGGNFTFALHLESLLRLKDLKIPHQAIQLYFQKNLENAMLGSWSEWTGPISRNDEVTVQKNIQSLEGTPLAPIYKEFSKQYLQVEKS
ncbi:MAG: DUF2520 domain-containing protein [Bdellovibrionia bacterium]